MEQSEQTETYKLEVCRKEMKVVLRTNENDSGVLSVIGQPLEGSIVKFKAILAPETLSKQLPAKMKKKSPYLFLIRCLEGKENHTIETHFQKGGEKIPEWELGCSLVFKFTFEPEYVEGFSITVTLEAYPIVEEDLKVILPTPTAKMMSQMQTYNFMLQNTRTQSETNQLRQENRELKKDLEEIKSVVEKLKKPYDQMKDEIQKHYEQQVEALKNASLCLPSLRLSNAVSGGNGQSIQWRQTDFINANYFQLTTDRTQCKIVVKKKGKYFLSCRLNLRQANGNWAGVYKNGSYITYDYYSSNNIWTAWSSNDVFQFNAGDKIHIQAYYSNFNSNTYENSLCMLYVGE